ncbi:MAG: hypothetical protein ABI683_16860 [Ginsengibacter sp.]
MRRVLLLFLIIPFGSSKLSAQVIPSDKEIMDSLLANDAFLKMLDKMDAPQSYFRINMAVGTRLFSGNNKAAQSLDNKRQLVLTPSAGYFHKSGLSASVAGYLLNENSSLNFYQYAISPSYSYTKSKAVSSLLSYTHYFHESKYTTTAAPFDDEIYANLILKKPYIKPAVSVSYSAGKYDEIINVDTTVIILNRPTLIHYVDTATTEISSFSVAASIEHDFTFYNLLAKKDGLRFTPQLSVISGINNYSVSHKSSAQLFNLYTKRRLTKLRRFQSSSDGGGTFDVQSIGLDIDLNYSIGKFYLEPEVYLDYYLPKTDDKAFTQVYNFNIGITF